MLLDVIKNSLAVSSGINVQVGPRNRFVKSGSATIAANSTGTVGVVIPLPVMNSGVAYWFEALAGSVTVAAKGLTITDVNLLIANSVDTGITTYGQATLTTLSPQATTALTFFPIPQLLQFEDITSLANQESVPPNQPFHLDLNVTLANSTAGGILATVFLNVLLRIVSGLQEG